MTLSRTLMESSIEGDTVVIRLNQSSRESDFPTELELPTRLLKHVLTGHGLRLGGRVLVAGCGHGELVAFLDGIAYSVDAVDDRSEEVDNLHKRFPRFQFHHARLDESVPPFADEFDLILVQDLCVYRDNLMDLKTRTATANLLACLKPEGELVFIGKQSGHVGCASGHQAGCWKRHLACFPGQLETRNYRESFFENSRWDWLVGRRGHNDYFTATLQTPPEKLTRAFWRDFARSGMLTGHTSCCVIGQVAPNIKHRAA
jgi:SAM-dependent methyltransferase